MSTAQFTCPLIVTIPGQLIASSLWNNEFVNLFTNINPLGVGAYSDTDPQMQTSTDPFPGGATSRPTSMGGELERIRYILNLIIGQTYWYQHPSISLETLNTSTPVIPAGTVMVFYQAAAPTGWTQVVSQNDKALRVVSGVGGGVGGTNAMSAGLSHTHTISSDGAHTHTVAAHTHTIPAHVYVLDSDSLTDSTIPSGTIYSTNSDGARMAPATAGGASTTKRLLKNATTSDTPGSSGSASPATDSQGAHTHGGATGTTAPTFQYIDVLLASKN